MEKVYIIGDCHLSRVSEHWYPENCSINFTMWGKAAHKIAGLSFKEMLETDMLSSGVELCRGIDHKPIGFSEIKDEGIVMLWLGYVDTRTFLSKYDNADDIAKHYINEIKNYFKNAVVKIIEPLPQFTEMLLKYEGISPYYTHEQRIDQNRKFLSSLHKYADEAGIEIIITQQDILDTLGVPELTPSMTHNDAPHPVDGLKPEYSKKIFELFYSKSQEALTSIKNK